MTDESKVVERPWWVTKRRWLIGGAVAAVALAVVLFFVLRGGVRDRAFIIGFRALDAGGAVIVWRANYEDATRSWVTRIDAMGNERWTRPVPEVAMNGGAGPLAITDGVVIVRYGRMGPESKYTPISSAAIAFDLETGKQLWDHEIAPHKKFRTDKYLIELHGLPSYVSDVSVGSWHVAAADGGEQDFLVGIEARTGKIGWKHEFDDSFHEPVVVPGAFILQYVDQASWTDVATGEETSFNVAYSGCALGGEFVSADHRGRLLARATRKPERVIAESVFDKSERVLSCGRYRDRYVFVVQISVDGPDAHAIVILDASGKRLHQIAVEGRPILDLVQRVQPLRAMLSGDQLPRFAPYAQSVYKDKDSTETLLMLDLETGTISWRGKPDPMLIHGTLYRAGSRWIWNDGGGAPVIAVFDGATGKLVSAVEAYSYNGIYSFDRQSWEAATADTLWIFSGDWTTPDAAPVAALDLATLQPRFPPRIVKLTDATDRVKAKLGL